MSPFITLRKNDATSCPEGKASTLVLSCLHDFTFSNQYFTAPERQAARGNPINNRALPNVYDSSVGHTWSAKSGSVSYGRHRQGALLMRYFVPLQPWFSLGAP